MYSDLPADGWGEVPATNQCSILYVKTAPGGGTHAPALRALGFRVAERKELPTNEGLAPYPVVIVWAAVDCNLPMLATRLRAKPNFGRRILLALVPDAMAGRHQREAVLSGFDHTVPGSCGARDLAAAVVRLLRADPRYRRLVRRSVPKLVRPAPVPDSKKLRAVRKKKLRW